jgi:hypothetical protein
VTTGQQWLANQANAKASTGPTSKAGKARSAKNALRHGLNVPVWNDPALAAQAEAIALKIAGPDRNPEALELARRIGEAQVDLNRVRALQTALVADPLGDPNYRPRSAVKQRDRLLMKLLGQMLMKRFRPSPSDVEMFDCLNQPKPLDGFDKLAKILEDRASELVRLDRYERRTLSRRKFAIRAFDNARASQSER